MLHYYIIKFSAIILNQTLGGWGCMQYFLRVGWAINNRTMIFLLKFIIFNETLIIIKFKSIIYYVRSMVIHESTINNQMINGT